MGKDTVVELRRPEQGRDLLTAMLQERAQWLVAEAVQVEFEQFLAHLPASVPKTNARRWCATAFRSRADRT